MKTFKNFQEFWKTKPLMCILVLALLVRMVSVVYSKGFGMHDDHFIVIEDAQQWIDKPEGEKSLPGCHECVPKGHSLFYPGLHFILFNALEFVNIDDAQAKMYVVRLLHALFSLLVIYFGYKIALIFANRETANQIGLLLAFFWFIPFLSVRNLVEFVCIPFLLAGVYYVIPILQKSFSYKYAIFAGIALGLAFNIRYQTFFFILGVLAVLFAYRKIKAAFFVGFISLFIVVIFQGLLDYYIWGKPFAEMIEYAHYNINNAYTYLTSPWYTYILFLLGLLIPPISLMLFWGSIYHWKKLAILVIPSLIFLIFHSYFPNKQERFILPIVPFIIIAGIIGWNEFMKTSKYWQQRKKLIKYCWVFFWIINLLALPVVSVAYSKKSRVEAMTYLSKKEKINYLLLEDTNRGGVKQLPLFYLEKWVPTIELTNQYPIDSAAYLFQPPNNKELPDYILFFGEENIEQRVLLTSKVIQPLIFEAKIKSGFIDELLHWLNPKNVNQDIYIYRTK